MSRFVRRRSVFAVIGVVAVLAGGATAGASAQGDTSAVAVNTKDDSTVFKIAFAIRRAMGDTVDQQNAAVAYASCDVCQTVAISIQVLLVQSDPSLFTPGNYAIAINQDCTLCDTLASAYQFAIGIGTPIKFTADGNREIADIRRQLEQLRSSGLAGPEIQSQVDALMGRLADVVQNELVGQSAPAAQPGSSGTDTNTTPTTPTGTTPTNTDTTPTQTTPTDTGTTSTEATPSDTTTTAPPPDGSTDTNTTTSPTTTTTSPSP